MISTGFKAALAAFFVFGAAGCSTKYVPIPTVCPSVPLLPVVMESELQSLADDAYRRLVERELRLKAHIGELRAMCEGGDDGF